MKELDIKQIRSIDSFYARTPAGSASLTIKLSVAFNKLISKIMTYLSAAGNRRASSLFGPVGPQCQIF